MLAAPPVGSRQRDTGYASPRRRPHLAGLLAVALIALAGGAVVAYAVTNPGSKVVTDSAAATQSQTPAASPSTSAPSWSGGRPGGVIHGQFTEPKRGGGYQTVDVQRGAVTAVSSSSITVKSADGYSATYAVSSSSEVTAIRASRGAFGFPGGSQN